VDMVAERGIMSNLIPGIQGRQLLFGFVAHVFREPSR
jgi:hypothetical protein